MGLAVILVGKDNEDTEKIKVYLNDEDIPFQFYNVEGKDNKFLGRTLPVVYFPGRPLEGVKKILSDIKVLYFTRV